MNANPLRGDRHALDAWRDHGRRRETSSIARGFGIAFGVFLFLVVLYVLYSVIVGL
jgi:hypothetical protein